MSRLTDKQRRILELKRAGRINKDIAFEMGCSENVVKKQINSIYRKLGIKGGTLETSKPTLTEQAKPEQAAALMDAATDPFANIARAIKESGLPQSTGEAFLRRLRVRYGKVPQLVRNLKTQDIIRKLNERIELALEYMDEKVIAEASFRDLAMGTSALLEKRQLLSGEPTQILSDLERKNLHELMPLLIVEAKRRGITIEGTAVKVDNPAPGVSKEAAVG